MTFAEYYLPWLTLIFIVLLFIDRGIEILAEIRTLTVMVGILTITTATAILFVVRS